MTWKPHKRIRSAHSKNLTCAPRGSLTFGFSSPLVRAFSTSKSKKSSGTRVSEHRNCTHVPPDICTTSVENSLQFLLTNEVGPFALLVYIILFERYLQGYLISGGNYFTPPPLPQYKFIGYFGEREEVEIQLLIRYCVKYSRHLERFCKCHH